MWKIVFRCLVFGLVGLCGVNARCFAQEIHHFTKGLLAVVGTRYGREALYSDPLAFQLYSHTLKMPVAGAVFGMNAKGKDIVWQALEADSLRRFHTRRLNREGEFGARGGYLYLSYVSDKGKTALLNITGSSGFFFNGTPHAGDIYGSGWFYIPVMLKKGINELYIRPYGEVEASILFPAKAVQLNTEDPTLPVIEAGAAGNDSLNAAVVVINSSTADLHNYRIRAVLDGKENTSEIPVVPAMSSRKVAFAFNGSAIPGKGHYKCSLALLCKGKTIDEKELPLDAAGPGEQYSVTFTSGIDGSLQYYAVTPQDRKKDSATPAGDEKTTRGANANDAPPGTVFAQGSIPGRQPVPVAIGMPTSGPALFLSVHGAGVEAIGQARAYRSKEWGTLVAATNRRPRGFNWEDWGRLDALEVLKLAKERFRPDPKYIYLTGHSMGGHGTWFLGATYPDKWAAIGACSGYPTLKDYGSHDGIVPDSGASPVEQMLIRASNQSDVIRLATNYKAVGVYILHGDSDKVVPVKYARQMRQLLGTFQPDMSYFEYPGGEHWFGNQAVDWKPLFDYFKWHQRRPDSLVNKIDFTTASPGISASCYWACVQQQIHPLNYSRMQLTRDPAQRTIKGETENIRILGLSLAGFGANEKLKIVLDGLSPLEYTTKDMTDSVFLLKRQGAWTIVKRPDEFQKGPLRSGTFKEAFNHHMVFVYGTTGNREENAWSLNKARYDAESWYYRGNGAVDIISDKEYTLSKYAGRGVILFGNASTNAAWKLLLSDCPIRVERGRISAGDQVWEGDELGAYFVWPLQHSSVSCVGVIGGTGLKGMEAANANQYFAGASGFPDFMLFGLDMLRSGGSGVKMAGFFDNDWKLVKEDLEANK
ncbi:MAG: alpha/beta hydrolase-fold protein [Bacteroidota bacterium]|nr:alpha/beta hydrolase-fold protein [Bacteroidota bacterium]MDP4248554.1 alpha/beta hydrolase-fold protein [Bacteroidota bacterium]